jgi:hypothetical protein
MNLTGRCTHNAHNVRLSLQWSFRFDLVEIGGQQVTSFANLYPKISPHAQFLLGTHEKRNLFAAVIGQKEPFGKIRSSWLQ